MLNISMQCQRPLYHLLLACSDIPDGLILSNPPSVWLKAILLECSFLKKLLVCFPDKLCNQTANTMKVEALPVHYTGCFFKKLYPKEMKKHLYLLHIL